MKKYLARARVSKNDEFYTRLEDIEDELKHYDLSGKVVYCNCDDPHKSNFVKYFIDNFNELGIDKLYATHYTPDEGLFCKNDKKPNFMLEYDGSYKYSVLLGDGDFRSHECVDILKRCDVVVTNPPFSLFREFVDLIMSHEKDFLVIGNQNAITYKDFFPHLKSGYVSLGVTRNKKIHFSVPNDYYESKSSYTKDGIKYVSAPAITWFTTLHHDVPTKPLKLTKTYNEKEYPKYDNYNAINVDRTADIPADYPGIMGVPITFLNRYNPEQFEILGMTKTPICFDNDEEAQRIKVYEKVTQHGKTGKKSSGNKINDGPAILLDSPPKDKVYYTVENKEGYLVAPYARILIRNRRVK